MVSNAMGRTRSEMDDNALEEGLVFKYPRCLWVSSKRLHLQGFESSHPDPLWKKEPSNTHDAYEHLLKDCICKVLRVVTLMLYGRRSRLQIPTMKYSHCNQPMYVNDFHFIDKYDLTFQYCRFHRILKNVAGIYFCLKWIGSNWADS